MIKVGILTSGGDCQGLNGAMYGLVKGLTETNKDKVEIYGILDGYTGLINGDYKKMKPEEFENILNLGGSILGNSRQPFKKIKEPDEKALERFSILGLAIVLTSLAADIIVRVMLVPVSPSGTGNTLRSLIHSFLDSRFLAPARNIFCTSAASIVVVATLFPPFCHKQGPSIYFIKTINL